MFMKFDCLTLDLSSVCGLIMIFQYNIYINSKRGGGGGVECPPCPSLNEALLCISRVWMYCTVYIIRVYSVLSMTSTL